MLNYQRKLKVSWKTTDCCMPRTVDINEYCWTALCNTRFLAQTNIFLIYRIDLLPIRIQPNCLHLFFTQYALAEPKRTRKCKGEECHSRQLSQSYFVIYTFRNFLFIVNWSVLMALLIELKVNEQFMKRVLHLTSNTCTSAQYIEIHWVPPSV